MNQLGAQTPPCLGHRLCRMGAWARRAAPPPRHLVTEMDSGALFARNPWGTPFRDRVAFADIGSDPDGWTADSAAFLGPGGSMAAPQGLSRPLSTDARRGARSLRGAATRADARARRDRRSRDPAGPGSGCASRPRPWSPACVTPTPMRCCAEVTAHWTALLGTVQVAHTRPRDGHPAERLAALSDSRLPDLGAGRVLPGERGLRFPRPVAGRHGADLQPGPK